MEIEIALFIHDMKNLRQSISRSDNSFVDVPPARENESHKMLAIFYRTASELDFAGLGRIAGYMYQAVEEPISIFCTLPVIR
jgi:hypothetical protein